MNDLKEVKAGDVVLEYRAPFLYWRTISRVHRSNPDICPLVYWTYPGGESYANRLDVFVVPDEKERLLDRMDLDARTLAREIELVKSGDYDRTVE